MNKLYIALPFILISTLFNSCSKDNSQTTFIPTIKEPEPEVYQSLHINSSIANDQKAPKIAIANNGNFLIVWKSQDGVEEGRYNIYAQLLNSRGDKIGGEFKVNNEPNTQNAHNEMNLHYDVTSNGLDNFVVVYSTDGATNAHNVFVQYYGSEDAMPIAMLEVNQNDTEITTPDVAIDSNHNGNIIITYQSEQGATVGHKYSLFNTSHKLLHYGWINTKAKNYNLDVALNDDNSFISGWNTHSLTEHVSMAKLSAEGKILNSFTAPRKTNSNNVQVDIGYDGSVLWLYKLKVDTHWVVSGKLFDKTMTQSKDFIDNEAKCDFGEDFSAVLDSNNSLYIVHVLSSYANATSPYADNSDIYYRVYNHAQDIKLVMNYGMININNLYDQKLPNIAINKTKIVTTWQDSAENNQNSDGIYAGIVSNL